MDISSYFCLKPDISESGMTKMLDRLELQKAIITMVPDHTGLPILNEITPTITTILTDILQAV